VIPDLLHLVPRVALHERSLVDILGLAAYGKNVGMAIDDSLAAARFEPGRWAPEFFEDDLFVRDFVAMISPLEVNGVSYPANQTFLRKALVHVPTDVETVHFRQDILRELEADGDLRLSIERLYRQLFDLVTLFKSPGYQATLDATGHHLDLLKQTKRIVDSMTADFAAARSGLRRLHEGGLAIQQGEAYATLADLLAYEGSLARLALEVVIGGDGTIRGLDVRRVEERSSNRFYRRPLRRLMDRLRLFVRGYEFTSRELMNRLTMEVFRTVAPALVPLVQLLGHLELYLTSLAFRRRAADLGLEVCLAELDAGTSFEVEELFNPLLMTQQPPPVPCSLGLCGEAPIVLVTGPNSGGKTRLLQAVGLTQLLGQSGLYVPARRARLAPASGLFVSLVEDESAGQTEGRLGRELVRIRSLFERVEPRAMVILDELCSGTNPSEGVEVFALVLRLLRKVRPTALLTTHFLDFARSLAEAPIVSGLEFCQVEVDERQLSTYQFIPGVAETSLAALTATRLGVTFERLSSMIEAHGAEPEEEPAAARSGASGASS
jgi:DNA mismatch repair protein MutS2